MKPEALIHRYLSGVATESEVTQLDQLLAANPDLRKKFIAEAGHDASLREIALERQADAAAADSKVISPVFRPLAWLSAAAAVVLLGALTWSQVSRPQVIAELISTEDAAWESSLPTEPGSKLTRGRMKLTSGIATIRFRSGAEMMLEAPSKLYLKNPMRARLHHGTAILDVPESAIGFALETPEGDVIDHGTAFAVNVADEPAHTNIEVIEGEVSIHLENTGEEVRLYDQQGATITDDVLSTYEGTIPESDDEPTQNILRIGTNGRSTSVIRANKEKWLHYDKLMVKRRNKPTNHERRSFFAFDLPDLNMNSVASVRLRLNQVPSGIGYASRLPVVSNIAVYGLTNEAKADWDMNATWESGPNADDGTLLGHIEIPRSRQTGSRFLAGDNLLAFLQDNSGESVTFILDGEVDPATGDLVPSLVLAFASDTHPEAAGPTLEFTFTE
ncbi:MAG: FecR domain-containing protein [Verrucomicrobiota bacterium]